MSNTTKNYEQELEQIREEARSARHEWIASLKAAKESKKERQAKIQEEIESRRSRLARLAEDADKEREELVEALMTGDTDTIKRKRKGLTAIEDEGRDVEAILGKLSTYDGSKSESETVLEAVAKYKAAEEASIRLTKEIDAILAEVKEKREHLEQLEQKIEETRRQISKKSEGANADEMDLIDLYEKSVGVIDVTGHHAGNDTTAKLRYLRGNTRGIENIPALKSGTEEGTARRTKSLVENLGSSDDN